MRTRSRRPRPIRADPTLSCSQEHFHGRTLLTMTMTSKKAYTTGLGPLATGVFRARFPYYYRNPEGMPTEKALDYYMQSIEDVFRRMRRAGYRCGNRSGTAAG